MVLPDPEEPITDPGSDIIRLCNQYINENENDKNPKSPIDNFKILFSEYLVDLENFLSEENPTYFYNINDNINNELINNTNKFKIDLRTREIYDVFAHLGIAITELVNPLVGIALVIGSTASDIAWDLIDKHEYIKTPIQNTLDIMNSPWNNKFVNCSKIYKSFYNLLLKISKQEKNIINKPIDIVNLITLTGAFLFKNGNKTNQPNYYNCAHGYIVIYCDFIKLLVIKDINFKNELKMKYNDDTMNNLFSVKNFSIISKLILTTQFKLLNNKKILLNNEIIPNFPSFSEKNMNKQVLELVDDEIRMERLATIGNDINKINRGMLITGSLMVILDIFVLYQDIKKIENDNDLINLLEEHIKKWNSFEKDIEQINNNTKSFLSEIHNFKNIKYEEIDVLNNSLLITFRKLVKEDEKLNEKTNS
jgi:hypothetical protein